jgi:plasmid replication initiation protein
LANPEYGMATIWDADIMIYLASHLNELRERVRMTCRRQFVFNPGSAETDLLGC